MIFLKVVVPILISVVCIYFSFKNVHWGEMKTIIAGADGAPIIAGACISLITFWLRAIRWKILLSPFKKMAAHILVRWQIGGLLVNNLLPLRMGDFARAYWAGHKSAIPKSTTLATIIIERVFDIGTIGIIGLILISLMGFYKANFSFSMGKLILALAVLAGLAFAFKRLAAGIKKDLLLLKLKMFLPEKLYAVLEKFWSGLEIFKDKKSLIQVASISPLIWATDIMAIAVISHSLHLNLTWAQSGMLMVGLILGVMVPAAPGAAGTYEVGGVAAMSLMGYDKTVALSFILMLHTFQYLYIFVLGLPILVMEGFNPKKLLENNKSEPI